MYFTLPFRSSDFRPSFADIRELRVFVHPGVPMLAATAKVTKEMREDVIKSLDLRECEHVFAIPS